MQHIWKPCLLYASPYFGTGETAVNETGQPPCPSSLRAVGKSGRKQTIIVSEESCEGQQEGVKRGHVGSLYASNFYFAVIFDFEIKGKIVARTVRDFPYFLPNFP